MQKITLKFTGEGSLQLNVVAHKPLLIKKGESVVFTAEEYKPYSKAAIAWQKSGTLEITVEEVSTKVAPPVAKVVPKEEVKVTEVKEEAPQAKKSKKEPVKE